MSDDPTLSSSSSTPSSQADGREKNYSLLRSEGVQFYINGATRRELEHVCRIYDITFEEIVEISMEFGVLVDSLTSIPSYMDKGDFERVMLEKMTGFESALRDCKKIYPAVEESIASLQVAQLTLENVLPKKEWINPTSQFASERISKTKSVYPEQKSKTKDTVWILYTQLKKQYESFLGTMNHETWPKNFVMTRSRCYLKVNSMVHKNASTLAEFYGVSLSQVVSTSSTLLLLLLKMEVKQRTGDLKKDLVMLVNKAKSLSAVVSRLCAVLEVSHYKIQTQVELIQTYGLLLQGKVKGNTSLFEHAASETLKVAEREAVALGDQPGAKPKTVMVPSNLGGNPPIPL